MVHHLVCTDGSKGTWDPDQDLADARRPRARPSSGPRPAALGATGEVVFLGWPDGELASGVRQRWEVAYWIRRLRPDVVLGHDPWKRYRLHPDHRHAGFLTVDGVVAARDPHFFPEQEIAHHRPDALLLFEADEPDHVEEVGEADVTRKLAALEAHESQLRSTMDVEVGSPAEADPARGVPGAGAGPAGRARPDGGRPAGRGVRRPDRPASQRRSSEAPLS